MHEAVLTGCKALGTSVAAGGGALVNGGVALYSSKVTDNLAYSTGNAANGIAAIGGGIVAIGTAEQTKVVHSVISGNIAHGATGPAEGGGRAVGGMPDIGAFEFDSDKIFGDTFGSP